MNKRDSLSKFLCLTCHHEFTADRKPSHCPACGVGDTMQVSAFAREVGERYARERAAVQEVA